MKRKLLTLTLVLFITTLFAGIQETHATAFSNYLPGGKNYLEPSNFDYDGTCLHTVDNIKLKSSQTYTLTVPDLAAPNEIYIYGANSDYADADSMTHNGEDSLLYTFTTTASETNAEVQLCGGMIGLYIDNYGMDLFQLEEGSTSTTYEAYVPPVVDETPPLINGASAVVFSNVSNPTTAADILATLTAADGVDGDVTASIYIKTDAYTGNEGTLGNYNVQYAAKDSANNETVITVEFRVVDVDKPIISLIGSSTVYVEFGTTYSEPGANVSDNYESLSAVITGTVNNGALGTYTRYYNATDSSGNAATQITRTVIVRDTTAPVQTLIGSSTVYVEFGSSYTEQGTTVTDNYDSGLSSSISSNVNIGVLGTYQVTYNITDSNGNAATQITRTVIVRDTTAANIVGDTSVSVKTSSHKLVSTILEDYTFNDLHDSSGNLTVQVINDNYTGNEETSGIYTFDIKVTDTSGNVKTQTITVTVVDDDYPVFTTSTNMYTHEYADSLSQAEIRALFGK